MILIAVRNGCHREIMGTRVKDGRIYDETLWSIWNSLSALHQLPRQFTKTGQGAREYEPTVQCILSSPNGTGDV